MSATSAAELVAAAMKRPDIPWLLLAGLTVAAGLCLGASSAAGSPARATGPPAGLTAYGRLTWNLEALFRDFYGTANVCMATDTNGIPSYRWTRSACNRAQAFQIDYFPLFARARHSAFSTTLARPPDLGNVAPIQIGTRYIKCSSRTWLVETGSGRMVCLAG